MSVATASKAKKASAQVIPPPSAPDPFMREIGLIPLEDIVEHGNNHRIPSKTDDAKINQLAESLKLPDGLLQSILVYRSVSGKYNRIFGFRRCEAAKRIGWKTIRAEIIPVIPTDAEVHLMRIIENFNRLDQTPAEKALAVWELVEAHTPMLGREAAITTAAKELGLDVGDIRDDLYVVDRLAVNTRDLLHSGALNFAQARELSKLGDGTQIEFGQQIADRLSTTDGNGGNYGGRVTSIAEIKGWIANKKHSLRVVGWELDQRMQGKPACVGCPYNSVTDLTLFGKPQEGAEKGECHNHECYDAKVQMTGNAYAKATEAIKKQIKAKTIDKADGASKEVVGSVIPSFVKIAAVQRRVKQDLGIAAPKKEKSDGAKGSGGGEKKPATEKERRQEALLNWANAYRKWREVPSNEIAKLAKVDARVRAVCILLNNSSSLNAAPDYLIGTGEYDYWAPHGRLKDQVKPPEEKPIAPKLAAFLSEVATALKTPLPKSWSIIAEDAKNKYVQISLSGCGPEMVARFADVFGVKCAPPPVFEDFLPADLKPGSAKASASGAGDSTANLKLGANEHGVFTKPATFHVKFPKPWKLQVSIDLACDTQGLFHIGYHYVLPGHQSGVAPSVKGKAFATRTLALEAACMDAENWIAAELKSKPNVVRDAKSILREMISIANEQPDKKPIAHKSKSKKSPPPPTTKSLTCEDPQCAAALEPGDLDCWKCGRPTL